MLLNTFLSLYGYNKHCMKVFIENWTELKHMKQLLPNSLQPLRKVLVYVCKRVVLIASFFRITEKGNGKMF